MSAHTFVIAGIGIRLESDQELAITERFAPFVDDRTNPGYRAVFHRVDELPPIPSDILYADNCHRVHPTDQGKLFRSFFDAPRDYEAFSLAAYDYNGGIIDIPYLEKGGRCVSHMNGSFYHLGMEGIMIRESRLCFHAACVETPLGGILFSGPSGMGKSTQADLWCKHRGGRLINGDRPILSLEGDAVLAWGSPYAGSSKCYVNENCTVSAIVLLKQAPKCSLRKLDISEAVRRILSGANIYNWDPFFVSRACDLAMEIAAMVPVYEFACTPDEEAVDFLENALKEGIEL